MKIKFKICLVLVIYLLCTIMCSFNFCQAKPVVDDPSDPFKDNSDVPLPNGGGYTPPVDQTVDGDSDTGLPTLDNKYKPSADVAGSKSTIELILGFLTVIGVVAIVVAIGLIGFNTILGSASEKAIAQEKYVGIVVAAIIITAGSTIARFLIDAAEKL